MLCVLDVDTTDQTKAGLLICQLMELSMDKARQEVRNLPLIYKSGVKYIRQSPKACAFRTPKDVFARKGGDCKQLVLWRIAELREKFKEHATPRIIWFSPDEARKRGLPGAFMAHALVRRADGTEEDTSLNLGMKAIQ